MEKNKFVKRSLVVAVSGAMLLQGCATGIVQKQENTIKDHSSAATERFESANKKEIAPLVSRSKGVWVSDKKPLPPVTNPIDALPEIFQSNVAYNLQGRYSLQEVLAKVTATQKVMTSINPDIGELTQQGQGAAGQAAGGVGMPLYAAQAGGNPNQLPPMPGGAAPAGMPASSANFAQAANRIAPIIVDDLVYNGPLYGLLDMISSKTNLSWRWIGGRVEFYKYETKTFYVTTLAGGSKMSSTINAQSSSSAGSGGSNSGSSSGSTSSSGQVVQTSVDLNEWPALIDTVKSALTPKGRVVVSEQTGMITVTDIPSALRSVDNLIKEFNRQFSKQIMLNVAVYTVDMSEEDNAAMDWNAFWQTASSKFKLGYASLPMTGVTVAAGGNTLTTTTMNGLRASILQGPWTDTNTIIGALASVGKASLMTRSTVVTLNGKPVPVQVAKETAYLASSQTTLTTGGTASTSLIPGIVTAGFSMSVLPKINDDGKVMMRYTVDLSSLDKMTSFSSGSSSIQLPEKSVRNFMNFASLKSGETLVLNGFEQVGAKNGSSGPFNPDAWALGGSRNAKGSRTSVVVLITPFTAE